jgi:ribosomal protein S18 acetylase RimI-like enzyme
MPQIYPADLEDPATRAAVEAIIREYAASLDQSGAACITSLDRELDTLGRPGSLYALPRGRFLLAQGDDDAFAGGAGLADLGPEGFDGVAELRRLYVRPQYRGLQLGRWLAMAAVHQAQELGYRRVQLETAPGMIAAQDLYESMGFRDIPEAGTENIRVMEMELPGR